MTTKSKLSAVALVISGMLPFAAWAQDTNPVVNELELGQDVIDGVVVGEVFTREEFGDWDMRCVREADGKDQCQLYQLLKDNTENAVAEISMFEVVGGGEVVAGATVIVPLETLLTSRLTIAVDRGWTKRWEFGVCTLQGCFASIKLTEEGLNGLRRGATATVLITHAADKDNAIGLPLSLSGFTAGFAAVTAENAANASE